MNYYQLGFWLAGMANIAGVLLFSKLLTNEVLMQANPSVMSGFGLIMILVWGLAYISISNQYKSVPLLVLVFTLEKLIYTISWVLWISENDLTALYQKDIFAGIFYSVYGANDFLSMLFFGFVFWKFRNTEK